MHRDKKTFVEVVPRLLRLRDAPFYLGVDRHRFNRGAAVGHRDPGGSSEELINAANKICQKKSGKTPALVVLKTRTANT